MALHSFCRCWLHLTWATLERRPLLDKAAAARLSAHLSDYAHAKGIYMRINFVNPDHVHALIDLPPSRPIEEVVQWLKGESSHWVNEHNLTGTRFAWQRGYGAFSVSHSGVDAVSAYIARQEEHHRRRSFAEELQLLVERHGMQWRNEENR